MSQIWYLQFLLLFQECSFIPKICMAFLQGIYSEVLPVQSKKNDLTMGKMTTTN